MDSPWDPWVSGFTLLFFSWVGTRYNTYVIHRSLLNLVVVLSLVLQQEVDARSPDQVPHSPIPSLFEEVNQTSSGVGTLSKKLVRRKAWTLIPGQNTDLGKRQRTSLPNTANSQEDSKSMGLELAEAARDYETQRKELWESPEMEMARRFVREFSRHSAQTSPEEGREFVEQLSQLSVEDLENWLERFLRRREISSRARDVDDRARQMRRDYGKGQQEVAQQSAERIATLRGLAAQQTTTTVTVGVRTRAFRRAFEQAALNSITLRYDPFIPVLDPSTPRGYDAKVAAAMSLPGDLPRDDPRNFIRDLESCDVPLPPDVEPIDP